MNYGMRIIVFYVSLIFTTVVFAGPPRPNIVLILVDDMGFADLGCYGSTVIETPNLDALSEAGVRFSQFYNMARCSPTRASLLTGLYPHQAGVGYLESMNKGEGHPGYRGQLNERCVTLAEVLKGGGYFTAIAGKWHVGGTRGVYPWERGFERSLSALRAAFYYPQSGQAKTLHLNGKPIDPQSDQLPKGWYSSDLYAAYGLRFIDEALQAKKPFFLYLAFNAPHFPLQAPAETVEKYRGKFAQGWDRMREPIYRKQIAEGIIDADWPMAPKHPDVPDWDRLKPEHRQRMETIQEVYAACVDRMDNAVGSLVKGLRQREALENTLIVFLSDNGACAEQGPFGRYGTKDRPGSVRSTIFQGQSWATYSNTPFRRYKHFTHEGGITTPCIMHWPAGISAKLKGRVLHNAAHVIDIMPTFLELSGAAYPNTYQSHSILPMEGVSLATLMQGETVERQNPIWWEHEGNRAVREGKWKLVSFNHEPWQLYDMEKDRTEQNDLAAMHPDLLKRLAKSYEQWAARCHVEPWPGKRNSAGQPENIEKKYQIQPY